MAYDRTNVPQVAVDPGVKDSIHIPAFVYNNPQGEAEHRNSSPNAGLAVFSNLVEGHSDTGVSHEGDLGGAG